MASLDTNSNQYHQLDSSPTSETMPHDSTSSVAKKLLSNPTSSSNLFPPPPQLKHHGPSGTSATKVGLKQEYRADAAYESNNMDCSNKSPSPSLNQMAAIKSTNDSSYVVGGGGITPISSSLSPNHPSPNSAAAACGSLQPTNGNVVQKTLSSF